MTRAFRVSGRVQGVGFRWFTTEAARDLGLRGSVRNLPDGAVEVRVAGPRDAVEALACRLGEGPPQARVRCVEKIASTLPLPDAGFRVVK